MDVKIPVSGKEYTLSFDRSFLDGFVDWADAALPSAMDIAARDFHKYPPQFQDALVRQALTKTRSKRSFHDPEVQSLLQTAEGAKKAMSLLFRRHHPEVSEEQSLDIIIAAEKEHGEGWLARKLEECANT